MKLEKKKYTKHCLLSPWKWALFINIRRLEFVSWGSSIRIASLHFSTVAPPSRRRLNKWWQWHLGLANMLLNVGNSCVNRPFCVSSSYVAQKFIVGEQWRTYSVAIYNLYGRKFSYEDTEVFEEISYRIVSYRSKPSDRPLLLHEFHREIGKGRMLLSQNSQTFRASFVLAALSALGKTLFWGIIAILSVPFNKWLWLIINRFTEQVNGTS